MKASDRLLEALGLHVSDGTDPDWEDMAASMEGEVDRGLIGNLRSLSQIAEFHRRHGVEECSRASGPPLSTAGPGHSPPVVGKVWEHLEILESVGRGRYGEVFRARDTRLNREVALKVIHGLDDETAPLPTTLQEGERLARIKHTNLVTIHGAAVRDGDLGLWMEYVRGATLQEIVEKQGPSSGREAILVGIDLCGALAAVHSAGLLHRDVKAQNVMREEGGRIVLMDLGAGTEIRDEGKETGTNLSGTPLYMAPEILSGDGATVRSDIYSLGVLLYFLVSGTYPVTARSLDELRRNHEEGIHRHLRDVRPDLPNAFVQAIERALAPNPQERYSTAGEMERALASSLEIARESGKRTGRPGSPPLRSRKGLLALLAGSVFLAAALILLVPGLLSCPAYTVEAALHRVRQGVDETILPGASVAVGDRLYLEFEASRSLHVYILAEDDHGESYILFPIPGQLLTNPLPEGRRHKIPPDHEGRRYDWGVSSVGGTEHLLIVASPGRQEEFERALAELPAPRRAAGANAIRLDREQISRLRGIGLLLEGESEEAGGDDRSAFAIARRLGGGSERNRGVWVRQIDLINSGP